MATRESDFSLQFRSDEDFTRLRGALEAASYGVENVCRRLDIPTIYHFKSAAHGRSAGTTIESPLDVVIRLFLDAEVVDRRVAESLIDPSTVRVFESFGLVEEEGEAGLKASVLLYPTEGLLIVSDLAHSPTSEGTAPERVDAVYPAITKNTQQFLSTLPRGGCDRFLDICAGTGIAALVSAPYAGHVWAADITERSKLFAEFNARLNGIANLTSVQGDLYEPVAGQTFDCIAAHPPYVPATEQKHIFRDGGQDGEQITRGVLAGLHEYLVEGGRCYCTCVISDRRDAPVEERVRVMLGEHQDVFDVAVVTMRTFHPVEHYGRLLWDGRLTAGDVESVVAYLRSLDIERLVYCTLVIQKRVGTRPVFTTRRARGPGTVSRHFDWLVAWETAAADPGFNTWLLDQKPVRSSHTRLVVSSQARDDTWIPEGFTLTTSSPFTFEANCAQWAAVAVARCDGSATVREHLRFLKDSGEVPPGAPEEEFAVLIRALVAGGFLEIEALPHPVISAG